MARRRAGSWALMIGGLLVVLGLAFVVSRFASSSPDGLEKVAQDEGFADTATEHTTAESPLADYGVRGVDDEDLATGLSGVIGVAVTFGAGLLVFGVFSLRPKLKGEPNGEGEAGAATASSGAST